MTPEAIDSICRALPQCTVRYPFDSSPNLRAWCIGKKMFAWCLTDVKPLAVQLKANPELVPSLIANYEYILPGYHMNKKHWITVQCAVCDDSMLQELLEDAHALVAMTLPRAQRVALLAE